MIGSPCIGCIFFDAQSRGCSVNEFCVQQGDLVIAPGLCKIRRDAKWKAKKEGEGEKQLLHAAIFETALSYDLIVLYDQRKHDLLSLCQTIEAMNHDGRVIVVDIGPADQREWKPRKIIDFIQEHATPKEIKYELMMEPIEDPSLAVHWASRLVTRPYFVVIEAGKHIENFCEFIDWFDDNSTRAVFYTFPFRLGDTHVTMSKCVYGLYVTSSYMGIGKDLGNVPYREKLAEEERVMGISLVWHSDRGVIV